MLIEFVGKNSARSGPDMIYVQDCIICHSDDISTLEESDLTIIYYRSGAKWFGKYLRKLLYPVFVYPKYGVEKVPSLSAYAFYATQEEDWPFLRYDKETKSMVPARIFPKSTQGNQLIDVDSRIHRILGGGTCDWWGTGAILKGLELYLRENPDMIPQIPGVEEVEEVAVPNHSPSEWARAFKEMYPDATLEECIRGAMKVMRSG